MPLLRFAPANNHQTTTTPEDQTMTPIDAMTPDEMRAALRALFGILYIDGREADGAHVVNPTKPWCSDTLGELSTWAADFGIAPEELDEDDGLDEVLANERNYPSSTEVL